MGEKRVSAHPRSFHLLSVSVFQSTGSIGSSALHEKIKEKGKARYDKI